MAFMAFVLRDAFEAGGYLLGCFYR